MSGECSSFFLGTGLYKGQCLSKAGEVQERWGPGQGLLVREPPLRFSEELCMLLALVFLVRL